MTKLADAVQQLEERQGALRAELAQIDEQLRKVMVALAVEQRSIDGAAAKKATGEANSRSRWFEPGEAATLMRKLIAKPTRPADVVRQLAAAKGYAGKLNKSDTNRFTWAVLSAIKTAVEAKRLVKHKDGKVVAA